MEKLLKAPLQEVIFELRWGLGYDSQNKQEMDLGFDMAQGRFKRLVQQSFPYHRRLTPPGLPLALLSHNVVHQFWKAENTYPLLQLGPGLFSQNDTEKNYVWESGFLPQLRDSLGWLAEAYEQPLEPVFLNLRYIDAVALTDYHTKGDWLDFVAESLKIRLENHFDPGGALHNFQINQSFALGNGSELNIVVSNGRRAVDKEPLLVWQTAVIQSENLKWEGLIDWVKEAHQKTRQIFESMTKGSFYESFK
ncbi:MAG: TIGR04255 family protein [Haliscomenobacteraceae bacterium CHB4]|nr:hypothetical protein [Saprospiraceae bacterium]MCE7926798.1 TIGR04255 family protein [Haliscomenobacteraceae bacterium CHB4]